MRDEEKTRNALGTEEILGGLEAPHNRNRESNE
jgi:hypothetical protein